MKLIPTHFLFVGIILLSSCDNEDKKSSKEKVNEDRNMFGLRISRGLTTTSEEVADGYIMFPVPNSASTYLINRKGEVVHEWKGNYGVMGVYLNDDGSLYQNVDDPDFPVFAGGGQSGRLQKLSWDNKTVWDFEYANEEYHAHHDIAIMPNGNVLAIAWEAKSYDNAVSIGRKPELIPKAGLWPDKIVEIKPDGKHGGIIVWEWHIWDHLVQDYDKTKANFGNPADHPELLDVNKGRPLPAPMSQDSIDILHEKGVLWRNQTADNRGSDVYHINAINYNADLDQIVFSSPQLSEIIIIDHSTTTKEAASHRGGRSGKGGDFLYRWGNPENYNRGDSTVRQLYHQHDVRWIETGKPGAGNLTIFNNDIPGKVDSDSTNYSAIFEISPSIDQNGNYSLGNNNPFGPEKPNWVYVASDTLSFYSSFISGAHRIQNGNTLINEGARGRFFEITTDGKIIWEYLNPYRGEIRKLNGDPVDPIPMAYSEFRSTFIPVDHPAFAGKELKPLDPQPKAFVLPPPSKDDKKM